MSTVAQPVANLSQPAQAVLGVCVNFGCGIDAPEGWQNFDNSPTIWLSRLPLGRRIFRTPPWPPNVRRHDVRKGLPFADGTVDCVYCSHVFQLFTRSESVAIARECLRVLKPGGVFRIAVPDLQKMVRDYLADPAPMASHRFIERLLLRHTWQDVIHPGAHGSQMFDSKSLVAVLQEAGFADPRVREFGNSGIPNILEVELASRKRETLYVEAEKSEAFGPGLVNRGDEEKH